MRGVVEDDDEYEVKLLAALLGYQRVREYLDAPAEDMTERLDRIIEGLPPRPECVDPLTKEANE